jgi:hypothetical protein
MSTRTSAGTALLTAALMTGALASTACNRGAEETMPVAEVQRETAVEGLERPVNVTGCLRAGDAAGTFVLTSTEAADQGRTMTYALNFRTDMNDEELREHVGEQVTVEGIVRSQQSASGYTPGAPAANEPVGTTGTPTVQTTTELAVQQLDVNELRPIGEACGQDR